MRKYTLKELREYVRLGFATDLTNEDPDKIPNHYEKIGYSTGIYGLNGGLIQDMESGQYYAILARSSNLFRIF